MIRRIAAEDIVAGILLLLMTCLAPLAAAYAAGEPFIRVQVETAQPVSVGQQVTIDVRVFVPNYFLSAPQFPVFDLPGAIVTLPDQGSLNLNDTIGGETFAGIQRSYVITPLQAGEFTLPPARISFTYAATPGQQTQGAVTLPPQAILVRMPAGAEGALLASGLTLTQSLDRDPANLKVGDTLTRTVTIAANGIQAMMIPPPDFEAVDGATVYPQQPVLQDESKDRAGLVGAKRTDKVIYRFDKAGDVVLPALTLDWFDPVANRRATASAPEIAVTVAAAAAFQTPIAPEIPVPAEPAPHLTKADWLKLLAIAIAVVGITTLVALLLPLSRRKITKWRTERRETEAACFARIQQACRSNDRNAVYRAITEWTSRAGAQSASDWIRQNGSEEMKRGFASLQQQLFGPSPTADPWDARPLLLALTQARSDWLRQPAGLARRAAALPALNP